MERREFITTALVAPQVLAESDSRIKTERDDHGFKVQAGEGRRHGHIKLKGVNENILDVKISGKDTNGMLAVFEQTSVSPKKGTPLHVHDLQDEAFQVLEGTYVFQVGEEKYDLKAGETIFLPRKVPHAWSQVSERGRMIVIFQPAGKLEEFFLTMAALTSVPNAQEMAKIFEDHEMRIVGPPLKID